MMENGEERSGRRGIKKEKGSKILNGGKLI